MSPSSDESILLLQANGRGYWETSEENLERLRQLYTDVEVRLKTLLPKIQDNCHALLLPAYVVHMRSLRFRCHAAAAAAARPRMPPLPGAAAAHAASRNELLCTPPCRLCGLLVPGR